MEVRSNFYRASPSITKLQSDPILPPNLYQNLQFLSKMVSLAKDLIAKCTKEVKLNPSEQLTFLMGQLERIIDGIGEDLGKILLPAFEYKKYDDTLTAQDMRKINMSHQTQNTQANSSYNGALALASLRNLEPLNNSFLCPLTKQIMSNPVTIESGVTYEKSAIYEAFRKQEKKGKSLTCPVTRMKIESKVLNINVDLKANISKWIVRNEATRMRMAGEATRITIACSALLSGSTVYDTIKELITLCQNRSTNIERVHKSGITKMLSRYLKTTHDATIRHEALELLCILVKDDEGKEIMRKTKTIQRATKLLSSTNSVEMHIALSFMLELSKSKLMVKMIGHTKGAILLLVTMKYNGLADKLAAEKSEEILKNLEKRTKNIKYMALVGYLDPLINNLAEGNKDMQTEMVGYLCEVALKQDINITIAPESRAFEALIHMIRTEPNYVPDNGESSSATPAFGTPAGESISKPKVRKAAFDVLVSISSLKPNVVPLLNAGIVPAMIEELFLINNRSEGNSIPLKIDAARVIVNLLESGLGSKFDPKKIQINKSGHTLASRYTMHKFVHMLNLSMPYQLNINLIRILLALSAHKKPLAAIVLVTCEVEVIHTIIDLLNSPSDNLSSVSAKLLVTLCPYIGNTIAKRLYETQKLGNLVMMFKSERVTERLAESANLLANLPHHNTMLDLCLLQQGMLPTIFMTIQDILNDGALTSSFVLNRYTKSYMEALVGILVRFTTTLSDPEILTNVVNTNLMRVFTDLLVQNGGSEQTQLYACIGLMNLSSQFASLSKPIEENQQFPLVKSTSQELNVCPFHRGLCPMSTNFCIIEAGAVDKLLGCLESNNGEVVGAALGELSTLLEDQVDIEKGIMVISEFDGVRRILSVLRKNEEQALWHKVFWIIERFLLRGTNKEIQEISADRVLRERLFSVFHSGDMKPNQVVGNVLMILPRMFP